MVVMMVMSSLIFEDGGVMTRKSYDVLRRPGPRGKGCEIHVPVLIPPVPIIFW